MQLIDPKYKEIFFKTLKEKNLKMRHCRCGAKLVLSECNEARISIDSCNHLGCMELTRNCKKYEDFVEIVCIAWNRGDYDNCKH